MDWDKLISKVLTCQLNVSIPKSSFLNCGHSLKVSQFLKEFLLSSILPKNQRNNSIIELLQLRGPYLFVYFLEESSAWKKKIWLCLTFSRRSYNLLTTGDCFCTWLQKYCEICIGKTICDIPPLFKHTVCSKG